MDKLRQKHIQQISGLCVEESWADPYYTTLEINKFSVIKLIMPALESRVGVDTLTFILRATETGWSAYCSYFRDTITVDIEIWNGVYNYCDDQPYKIQIEWNTTLDLEKKLRDLHRKILLASSQSINTKKVA